MKVAKRKLDSLRPKLKFDNVISIEKRCSDHYNQFKLMGESPAPLHENISPNRVIVEDLTKFL